MSSETTKRKKCLCGCGEFTTVLEYDEPKKGLKAGDSRDYVNGHYHLHMREIHGEQYGSQNRRQKQREKVREALVGEIKKDQKNGKNKTLEDVYEAYKEYGFEKEGISRLINSAVLWGYVHSKLPRRAIKRIAPYERKIIPYEFETELPLLTNYRNAVSLDSAPYEYEDGSGSYHERISGYTSTPFEIVCMKEEEPERFYRSKEIVQFKKYKPFHKVEDYF